MRCILDLCGGTGAWSKPYKDAGYYVVVIDADWDVRKFEYLEEPVHGILAAPPCTHFAISGARWWKEKGEQPLLDGLSVVDACLRIVTISKPTWWALENPVGRLSRYLGKPKMYFNPCDYGDPWTKKTGLWGEFQEPIKNYVEPVGQWIGGNDKNGTALGLADHFGDGDFLPPDWIHKLPESKDRATLRSLTPPGFAQAFFEANP